MTSNGCSSQAILWGWVLSLYLFQQHTIKVYFKWKRSVFQSIVSSYQSQWGISFRFESFRVTLNYSSIWEYLFLKNCNSDMPWELVGDRWSSLEPASEHPALYLEQRSEFFVFCFFFPECYSVSGFKLHIIVVVFFLFSFFPMQSEWRTPFIHLTLLTF